MHSNQLLPDPTFAVTRAAHRMFAEFSADAALTLSPEGDITHANDSACALLGVARGGLTGQGLYSFVQEGDVAPLMQALQLAYSGSPQSIGLDLLSSGGDSVHVQGRLFLDPATLALWFVGYDASDLRRTELELRRLATHDTLTGLPNRALLNDRIAWHIGDAKRVRGLFATVAIDLDGFKKANDAFGHLAGDELLKEVALRLRACVREKDTVSRTGGDEFVLVLAQLRSTADAQLICNRILDALRRPVSIHGQDVYVSGSLGVAMYPEHGSTVEELTQHADQAMYLAKQQGKSRLAFYTPELAVSSTSQFSLETSMHAAINNGEFLVHYQPLLDCAGVLRGCEALMRWFRPDGTAISPADFIPVAENNGLITMLGEYVLRTAVMQLRRFDQAGLTDLYVSVNVSPRQLRHPDFEKTLKKVLAVSGIAPSRLVLEITEGMLMNGQERTQALLRQIAATGVQFSLDDFGTGYSCLAYLKTYPISALKVDRSFLRDIEQDEVSGSIVQAIVSLAQALKLKTVVEGVETEAQAALLRRMNVDYLQGYLYARPLAPAEFISRYAPTTVLPKEPAHVADR